MVKRVTDAGELEEIDESHADYHDACLVADIAREELGAEMVVWSRKLRRVLYDSRLIAR